MVKYEVDFFDPNEAGPACTVATGVYWLLEPSMCQAQLRNFRLRGFCDKAVAASAWHTDVCFLPFYNIAYQKLCNEPCS
jgi:hypothetical protein